MVHSSAQLLALQSNIKRDPEGYKDEFDLQYKHYKACLELFKLKPSNDSREFIDLISFVAQVSKCYPDVAASFSAEVMALLEGQAATLDPPLRKAAVQALILLRNRHQLDPTALLPLLFRLFSINDKALRELLFRHIVADLKSANQKGRNERLNRGVQSFLFRLLQEDNELAAKKALAVCTELWRRNIWRDARTVNCIATAVFHKSPRVMLAALKFFMGQDADPDSDEEEEEEQVEGGKADAAAAVVGPTKEEIYKANRKGTKSSKRKKQAKLKRVIATVKKAARREASTVNEGFAALHLLHDPQSFAERLAARLAGAREKWDTRLAMMQVTSRVIGVHKLLVLNFYPFLQKYIAPHQRDVTLVLAALIQAVHDLVPPEVLAPVLRQLVDQFVHDKARPEVMTVGLKTTRELCFRCPLVMPPELLQDLAEYKKFRDREVASAARGLIGLFRDINPALLAKKDRGRGADLEATPLAYGVSSAATRVEGADLLQAALLRGEGSEEDSDFGSSSGSEEEGDGSGSGGSELGEDEEEEGSEWEEAGSSDEEVPAAVALDSDQEEGEEGESGSEEAGSSGADTDTEQDEAAGSSDAEAAAAERQGEPSTSGRGTPKSQQQQQAGSIADLKRQLSAAKAAKAAAAGANGVASPDQQQQEEELDASVPLEMQRILTEKDFARIRRLKHKRLVESAMSRHGLKDASAAKKRRMKEVAREEAEEASAMAAQRQKLNETKVNPDDLKGVHKKRQDKAERLASVMEGREGREAFGARASLKKKKTGGMSEREKQRKKALPVAARIQQLRNRANKSRQKNNPRHFKGHVRK